MSDAEKLAEIRALSDRLLASIATEPIDVGLMALVDGAVRCLRVSLGIDGAAACGELVRIIAAIAKAEAGL